MSAAFAVQDTGPGWDFVVVCVLIGVTILAALHVRDARREQVRQAARERRAHDARVAMADAAIDRAVQRFAAAHDDRLALKARAAATPGELARIEDYANQEISQ